MSYVVKERVGLPVLVEREVHPGIKVKVPSGDSKIKEPGAKITQKELDDAGQTADDIKSLIASGAIEEE